MPTDVSNLAGSLFVRAAGSSPLQPHGVGSLDTREVKATTELVLRNTQDRLTSFCKKTAPVC